MLSPQLLRVLSGLPWGMDGQRSKMVPGTTIDPMFPKSTTMIDPGVRVFFNICGWLWGHVFCIVL